MSRAGDFEPQRVPGKSHELIKPSDQSHINWQTDCSALVLAKLNAADGFPGVADSLFGQPLPALFDAWAGGCAAQHARYRARLARNRDLPGDARWRRWMGHVKRPRRHRAARHPGLPEATDLPELPLAGCWKAARPYLAGYCLRRGGGCRFPEFRVLQRRDEHRAVPAPDRGLPLGRRRGRPRSSCCAAAAISGRTAFI